MFPRSLLSETAANGKGAEEREIRHRHRPGPSLPQTGTLENGALG